MLTDKVLKTIEKYRMLSPGDYVSIGVSGGPDSVCLASVLSEMKDVLKIKLHVFHLNHKLRGKESERDAKFVKRFAEKLDIPCAVNSEDVKKEAKSAGGVSLQAFAREIRYRKHAGVCKRVGAKTIAVGHTLSDNAETVLLWLVRGAGVGGLKGIPRVNSHTGIKIIRPLIEVGREEIMKYVEEKKLKYVVDSSNLEDHYLRNKIRNKILPGLRGINRNILNTIARLSDIVTQEDDCLNTLSAGILEKVAVDKGERDIRLDVSMLKTLHTAVLRRVLRKAISHVKGDVMDVDFEHVDNIANYLRNPMSGRTFHVAGPVKAVFEHDRLRIYDYKDSEYVEKTYRNVLEVGATNIMREIGVSIGLIKQKPNEHYKEYLSGGKQNVLVEMIDFDSIKFPVFARPFKQGDRFMPLGMNKKKLVSDFFTDKKVPLTQRQRIPIIEDAEKILSVGWLRIDERAKVTEKTKNALYIRIELL